MSLGMKRISNNFFEDLSMWEVFPSTLLLYMDGYYHVVKNDGEVHIIQASDGEALSN